MTQSTASNAQSVILCSRHRLGWIRFAFNPTVNSYVLTAFQHYDARHRFECPECDDEFTTWAAMDQASFSPIVTRLGFSPTPLASQCGPLLYRLSPLRS